MSKTKQTLKKIVKKIPLANNYAEKIGSMRERIIFLEQHNQYLEADVNRLREKLVPHIRMITNQLDATGAPLIFMDIVRDMIATYPDAPLAVHTYLPANEGYAKELNDLGVKLKIFYDRSAVVDFVDGDVIVLNTVAHTSELLNTIYRSLESGVARKLVWYIHEDWPHIFFSEEEKMRVGELLRNGKISILSPAIQATKNIQDFFGLKDNIRTLPYRLSVPEDFHHTRSAEDFEKLTFVMVGKTGEGLKGHLPILYAFITFKKMYYNKNPEAYRDFELRFIAIEADYLSLQILRHAKALGRHFRSYPPLSHEKALDMINESNVTVCYSLRECLPIFVFEGMISGHVILRNDVSGMAEQLQPSKNGYLLDSQNYEQVVDTIETVLNLKNTPGKSLSAMSKASFEIATKYEDNSYKELLDEVWFNFSGGL